MEIHLRARVKIVRAFLFTKPIIRFRAKYLSVSNTRTIQNLQIVIQNPI